jgi:hypothetical protein
MIKGLFETHINVSSLEQSTPCVASCRPVIFLAEEKISGALPGSSICHSFFSSPEQRIPL